MKLIQNSRNNNNLKNRPKWEKIVQNTFRFIFGELFAAYFRILFHIPSKNCRKSYYAKENRKHRGWNITGLG